MEHKQSNVRAVYSIALFNTLLSQGFIPLYGMNNTKHKGGWVVFFKKSDEIDKAIENFVERVK